MSTRHRLSRFSGIVVTATDLPEQVFFMKSGRPGYALIVEEEACEGGYVCSARYKKWDELPALVLKHFKVSERS